MTHSLRNEQDLDCFDSGDVPSGVICDDSCQVITPVTVFCSCFNHTFNVSGAIFRASQLSHGFTIGEGKNGRHAHT